MDSSWVRLVGAVVLSLVATAVAWTLHARLTAGDEAMILLLGVITSGAAFGLLPALVAAAVSGLAYDYLFLNPRFTFGIERPADVLTFAMFFAVALAVGWLGGRARDGERRARKREAETRRLLTATRRLASTGEPEALARVLAQQAQAASGLEAAVLLGPADGLEVAAAEPPITVDLEPLSRLSARWTYERREPSGAGTGVNPQAEWSLHLLRGSGGAEGVLALRGAAGAAERLVQGVADSGGLALERARLAGAAAENEALRRADRLRASLLNSLSHDLRTPLAGILGSTTTLIDYGAGLSEPVRADLLQGVREEAERLGRYISDLLDLSRLEAGALAPRLQCVDLRDVAAAALARVADPAAEAAVPASPALAEVDPVLLEQAVVNVLENAKVHGGAASLRLRQDGEAWRIEVEDDGSGLAPDQLEQVFKPFIRGDAEAAVAPGSGLGLSIARGFIEAMGGALWAESPATAGGRGARFVFRFAAAAPGSAP